MTRVSFSMSFRPPEPDCVEPKGDDRVPVPRCRFLFKERRPSGERSTSAKVKKEATFKVASFSEDINLFCCLCLFNQSCESFLVVYSQFSQHFAVQLDTGLLQTVHKGGVVHTANLCLSRDSGDPELAEISLLLLSADECIVAALHNSLLSHLEVLALGTPIAFCGLQNFLSSCTGYFCKFDSCHFNTLRSKRLSFL